MSTIARRIAASPKRTATEAWEVMSRILCEESSPAGKELSAVKGVVASIISEEIPQNAPFIVKGVGPRIRIYYQYGEDALNAEGCNEELLTQKPMTDTWKLYVPCAEEDLKWISSALKSLSSSVVAYDKATEPDIQDEASEQKGLTLNIDNFLTKL